MFFNEDTTQLQNNCSMSTLKTFHKYLMEHKKNIELNIYEEFIQL